MKFKLEKKKNLNYHNDGTDKFSGNINYAQYNFDDEDYTYVEETLDEYASFFTKNSALNDYDRKNLVLSGIDYQEWNNFKEHQTEGDEAWQEIVETIEDFLD